jgi:accessory colonization factor AcfA
MKRTMMKTIPLYALALCAFPTFAAPYVGVGYALGYAQQDQNIRFNEQPSSKLDPNLEDGITSLFAGYTLSPSWAIELGYRQYDLDDSHTANLGTVNQGGKDYYHSKEWDASVDAKQVYLAPVWRYQLSEKWQGQIKAGLTYTQYQASQSLDNELELITNDDIEINNRLEHQSKDHNQFGGLVSVGVAYQLMPQWFVGGDVQYQADSFAQVTAINIATRYRF